MFLTRACLDRILESRSWFAMCRIHPPIKWTSSFLSRLQCGEVHLVSGAWNALELRPSSRIPWLLLFEAASGLSTFSRVPVWPPKTSNVGQRPSGPTVQFIAWRAICKHSRSFASVDKSFRSLLNEALMGCGIFQQLQSSQDIPLPFQATQPLKSPSKL